MASRGVKEMLRTLWEREPVVTVSIVLGTIGPALAFLSPLRKQQDEENRNWVRGYPFETLTYKKPGYEESADE